MEQPSRTLVLPSSWPTDVSTEKKSLRVEDSPHDGDLSLAVRLANGTDYHVWINRAQAAELVALLTRAFTLDGTSPPPPPFYYEEA